MKKRFARFSSLVFISGSLAACGSSPTTTSPTLPPTTSQLTNGSYTAGCQAEGSNSQINTYVIDDNTLSGSTTAYLGSNSCAVANELGPLALVYDVSTGAEVSSPQGAQELNMTLVRASFTPGSAAIAAFLNTSSYCGITDWVSGVTNDVTGKNCSGSVLSAGMVLYSLIKINGTGLYLGVQSGENDGSTVEKRHNSLAGPYVKQ
jgi:hypothetical protein